MPFGMRLLRGIPSNIVRCTGPAAGACGLPATIRRAPSINRTERSWSSVHLLFVAVAAASLRPACGVEADEGQCTAGTCKGDMVQLTGHYAELTGPPAEQAKHAFSGVVPTRSEEGWAVATFAAGCFWGPQLLFDRLEGVMSTTVGYVQGHLDRPTYNHIGSGRTGHTEAVQVLYDDKVISYEELLKAFWGHIDPTVVNGQGHDFGPQYRTGIYYHTDEQREIAELSRAEQQKQRSKKIATELEAAQIFWPAEQYHQNYLSLGGRFGRPQSTAKGNMDKIRCYG